MNSRGLQIMHAVCNFNGYYWQRIRRSAKNVISHFVQWFGFHEKCDTKIIVSGNDDVDFIKYIMSMDFHMWHLQAKHVKIIITKILMITTTTVIKQQRNCSDFPSLALSKHLRGVELSRLFLFVVDLSFSVISLTVIESHHGGFMFNTHILTDR